MLIHKTMKVPTSCLSCWIAPTCEVWVREKSKYKGYDDRLDECPLEEVKHGHWIVNDNRHTCRCSCCENVELVDWALEQSKYCPNCGAKMDEVETDE